MRIYYFLFGSEPVNEYFDTGTIKSKEGCVVRYDDEEVSPLSLLDWYTGWDNYVEITEEEYLKFKKHFQQ